jgi:alpha-1,2-mannosyltransferase
MPASRTARAAILIGAVLAAAIYLWAWGRRDGLDLRVYRDSVAAWRSGHDPYLATLTASRLPFTYPPFALLALSPLTWASFPVTQWLLWAADIVSATVSVVLVLRDAGFAVDRRLWCGALSWSCMSIIILEPARSAASYGQVEFVLMLVVVADLLAISPRYRGIAIGVAAAVKLTPMVFVMVFIARRDLRSASRALASFAACTAVSWLLSPGLPGVYWDRVVTHPARAGRVSYAGNQSWYAILHRPPFPATGSAAAWLLLSLATLAVAGFVVARSARANRQAAALICAALAGLLISPISWSHHWVWVLLIPPMIVGQRGREVPRAARTGLWGVVALTVAGPYWWFGGGIPADVAEALLPLCAAGSLAVWAASCLAAGGGDGEGRRDIKRRLKIGQSQAPPVLAPWGWLYPVPLRQAADQRYDSARGGRGAGQPVASRATSRGHVRRGQGRHRAF